MSASSRDRLERHWGGSEVHAIQMRRIPTPPRSPAAQQSRKVVASTAEALSTAGNPRTAYEVSSGIAMVDVGELDDSVLHPPRQGGDLSDGTAPVAVQVQMDHEVNGSGDGGNHEGTGDVLAREQW